MDVKEAIETRRAYRSLSSEPIADDLLDDLARAASLAPSCYNKQPWRFVFVRSAEPLSRVRQALSPGNAWATTAPCIIAVLGSKEDDCIIGDREYWAFDIGIATAFLILRATELGLVAHPIAGYVPETVRSALGIPDTISIVALIVLAHRSPHGASLLSAAQRAAEMQRPERRPLDTLRAFDTYHGALR